MFRIKVCGITRPRDAELAVGFGADAIGLNFYPPSPRFVSVEDAKAIAENARAARANRLASDNDKLTIVGVFVNASTREMNDIASAVGLDAIQLHGDEPSSQLAELKPSMCIRALRLQSEEDPHVRQIQEEVERGLLEAVLVDAYSPDLYGGSGKTAAWDLVPRLQKKWPDCKTILAGGLSPDNVAEALEVSKAHGVDVASGVEEAPGTKSEAMLRVFIERANHAIHKKGQD